MKRVLLTSLLFLISSQFSAQNIGSIPYAGFGIPYYEIDFYRHYQLQKSFVIAKLHISYDDLVFKKDTTGYYAKYRFTLYIFPEGSDISSGHISSEYELNATNFDETNDRTIVDNHVFEFDLPPGKYRIESLTKDLISNKEVTRKEYLVLENIKDHRLLLSDIFIIEKDPISNELLITSKNSFSRESENLEIHIDYTTTDLSAPLDLTIEYLDFEQNHFFSYDSSFWPISNGRIIFPFGHTDPPKRNNIIQLTISQNEDFHQVKKVVNFYWTDLPTSDFEMDEALNAMVYIEDKDSINYYLKKSTNEKKEYFKQYWQVVDSTTYTKNNEIMKEYFSRVRKANLEFSRRGKAGYKTDFGRIFIKFGQPDRISYVNPDDSRGIWDRGILWEYFDLNKKFLFSGGILNYKYQIYE